jgi:hypothetical protein
MRTARKNPGPRVHWPLALTLAWALLASAACLTTFAISSIPAPMPDGRNIPFWLECCEGLLAVAMIPACALIPLPLLVSVIRLLRRRIRASRNCVAAWTVAASAGAAIEGLFMWRLVRNLTTPFANLPTPSWHALDFGVSFLAAGIGMALALAGAARSARKNPEVGPPRGITTERLH